MESNLVSLVSSVMKVTNAVYFAESVAKVFDTMVKMKATCGQPKVLSDGSPTADVTGIITFSGDLVGAMILTFPVDVAKAVVDKFAGIQGDVHDPELMDAIGELANMVAGQAKSRYQNYDAMISIPTVVCGQSHHVNRRKSAPWVVLGAECEAGKFVVAMSLQEKKL